MKETTPSDRVQLIDRGSLMHPGCCALCGSGNCDEGYVDTGIYYDYEGQVYLCWNCAMQIAAVIGCLSAEEHTHVRELLDMALERAKLAEKELVDARERLNNYDSIVLRALRSGDSGPVVITNDELEAQQDESGVSIESPSTPAESTDSGEPVAKKSAKGSGRRIAPRTERSDSNAEGLVL